MICIRCGQKIRKKESNEERNISCGDHGKCLCIVMDSKKETTEIVETCEQQCSSCVEEGSRKTKIPNSEDPDKVFDAGILRLFFGSNIPKANLVY